MPELTPVDSVLAALERSGRKANRNGRGWRARCPAHDDRAPSLSVAVGDDGRALLHCHAGCNAVAIVGALGLTLRDLMPSNSNGRAAANEKSGRTFGSADDAVADLERLNGQASGRWDYHDSAGSLVGCVLRWDAPSGKTIRPVALVGGRWRCAAMPAPRPIYGLPAVKENPDALIVLTEGERCADAARSIGLLGVTSAGGAQAASRSDWTPLAGRDVLLLPDNDGPGEKYVGDAAAELGKLTPAPTARVLRLPGLPDGGDIVDFLKTRDGVEPDALRAEILRLAADAPAPEPAAAPAAAATCADGYRPAADGAEPQTFIARATPSITGELFIEKHYTDSAGRALLTWAGETYVWSRQYQRFEGAGLRAEVHRFMRTCFQKFDDGGVAPFEPKAADVSEVAAAVAMLTHLPERMRPPCWLDVRPGFDALDIAPVANGLLDLASGALHPSSPRFFCTNASPVEYAPEAQSPAWTAFLHTLWPDDPESIATLQEFVGYLLTCDTRQQKALMLVGPKRSGKGTIGRVVTALLGEANVCGPSLASLQTNFGLWCLVGRPLAIVSDARISGRADQAVVVERLLSIVGEDLQTVDRKNLEPLSVRLPTRFLVMSNELPRLQDSSGAFASRFIILRLVESFFGREDVHLTERLLSELPGILRWAVEGWRRLRARGHFIQPRSAAEDVADLADLCSPVAAFVRDACAVGPAESVSCSALFAAWRGWCREQGRDHAGTVQSFGRDIRSAFPTVNQRQPRAGEGRRREYVGIGLTAAGWELERAGSAASSR